MIVAAGGENVPNSGSPSAAILDGATAKTIVMPLPGSTGGDVLTYNGVTTSGNNVTIDATPRGYVAGQTDALTKAFNDNEFQLMTTQQINDTISDVIFNGVAADAYASAVSIFDALGGGPLTGTTARHSRRVSGAASTRAKGLLPKTKTENETNFVSPIYWPRRGRRAVKLDNIHIMARDKLCRSDRATLGRGTFRSCSRLLFLCK